VSSAHLAHPLVQPLARVNPSNGSAGNFRIFFVLLGYTLQKKETIFLNLANSEVLCNLREQNNVLGNFLI
jgi:hypothetical protein